VICRWRKGRTPTFPSYSMYCYSCLNLWKLGPFFEPVDTPLPVRCSLRAAANTTCTPELWIYLFAVTCRWRSLVLPNPLTQLHSREFEDVLNRAWSLLADPGKWLSYDEQMIKSTARAMFSLLPWSLNTSNPGVLCCTHVRYSTPTWRGGRPGGDHAHEQHAAHEGPCLCNSVDYTHTVVSRVILTIRVIQIPNHGGPT